MSATTLPGYGQVTITQVYSTFLNNGVNQYDANVMASQWLLDNIYGTGRSFSYSQNFPATDAACTPAPFARSFQHVDWVDGESVVQASATPGGDEGFNARLHKIETDLDRLGGLIAQAFTCMNAMRANLSRALGEVRDELNRINADVSRLKRGNDPRPGVGSIVEKLPKYLGDGFISGKQVKMWSLEDGRLVSLPTVQTMRQPLVGDPVERGAGIAEVLAGNPAIRRDIPGQFTVQEVRQKFGDRLTADGRSLNDILDALPDEQRFENLDAMVQQVNEMDAMVMKGTGGARAVRESMGQLDGDIGAVAVGKMPQLGERLAGALTAAGVRTVGDLAKLEPEKLNDIAARAGAMVTPGEAGALLARAQTIVRL